MTTPYRARAIATLAEQRHTLALILESAEKCDSFDGQEVKHNLDVLQRAFTDVAVEAVARYKASQVKVTALET